MQVEFRRVKIGYHEPLNLADDERVVSVAHTTHAGFGVGLDIVVERPIETPRRSHPVGMTPTVDHVPAELAERLRDALHRRSPDTPAENDTALAWVLEAYAR